VGRDRRSPCEPRDRTPRSLPRRDGDESFRNLRLFPKLPFPFLTLTLVIGVSGAFLVVRGLA
jgi:hypothetical protein